jgi:hypothetical protein
LKITWFQSMAVLGRDAQDRDRAAVVHGAQHLAQGGRIAGHLQPDVKALLHP